MESLSKKQLLQFLNYHPDSQILEKKSKTFLCDFITMHELTKTNEIPSEETKEKAEEAFSKIFNVCEYHPNQIQYHNS